MLEVSINSDEFKSEATKYCKDKNICFHKDSVDIFNTFKSLSLKITDDELKNVLVELGGFSAEFYFSLKEASSKDIEKFLYKYKILPSRYENGIILYRNAFSISSYDGKRDWIKLGTRSRLSPAAATHPTGSWRVRENQLSGKVEIDKKENGFLMDLSNRQGLDENLHYEMFVAIIDEGIVSFERYRQGIIRQVNSKNVNHAANKDVVDKIIRNPQMIRNLTNLEVEKFVG